MSVTINAFFISCKKNVYFLLEYISEPVLHYLYLCKGAESALSHLPEYLVGIHFFILSNFLKFKFFIYLLSCKAFNDNWVKKLAHTQKKTWQ